MPEKAHWTILTYIAAHNNLDALGQRSLDQILQVGSTPQVRLAALYDGTSRAARYIAGDPGTAAVKEPLEDFDSGDGDALVDTARWAFKQCPAERYGLVLWSHGTGWRPEEIEEVAKQARGDKAVDVEEATERAAAPGSLSLFRGTLREILKKKTPAERAICFDDGTGHSLDTLELERVAGEIQATIDQRLDLLGMDACLMATVEVAYQLRQLVRYLVASEELVPGHSWPYDTILGELSADPQRPARDLATSVVRHYVDYYGAHPPGAGDVTKVALDLSRIDPLVQATDAFAAALEEDMDQQADSLWDAQWQAYLQESRQEKRYQNKFRLHMWDLGSVAARMTDSENAAVQKAAQDVVKELRPGGSAVVAEGHYGSWFDGIGGVSAYFTVPQKQRLAPAYAGLAFAKDTHWLEMLKAYHDYY